MRPTRYLAALLLGGTLLTPAAASAQTMDTQDQPRIGSNPSADRGIGSDRANGNRPTDSGAATGDRGTGDRSARAGQGSAGGYTRAECEMWREHFQRHFQRHHGGRYDDDRRHWRDDKGYRHHRQHHGRDDDRRYGRHWDDERRRGVWRDDREREDFRRWREERDREDYRRWREERGGWRDRRDRDYGDWRDDRGRSYRDWRDDRDREYGDWRDNRSSGDWRDDGRPSDRWRGDTGRDRDGLPDPSRQDGGDDWGNDRSGEQDGRRYGSDSPIDGYDEYDGGGQDRSSPDGERSDDRSRNRDSRGGLGGQVEEDSRI